MILKRICFLFFIVPLIFPVSFSQDLISNFSCLYPFINLDELNKEQLIFLSNKLNLTLPYQTKEDLFIPSYFKYKSIVLITKNSVLVEKLKEKTEPFVCFYHCLDLSFSEEEIVKLKNKAKKEMLLNGKLSKDTREKLIRALKYLVLLKFNLTTQEKLNLLFLDEKQLISFIKNLSADETSHHSSENSPLIIEKEKAKIKS